MVNSPVVNLNGTDGKVLLENYKNVMEAAKTLMEVMSKVQPHGRDWQTVSKDRFEDARKEWVETYQKALDVHQWALENTMSVYDQIEAVDVYKQIEE